MKDLVMINSLDLRPLGKLTEMTQPTWGIMTSQHMVEHLCQAVQLSNGNLVINECMTPEDKLPLLKRILMSPRPLPKNFTNTVIGEELKLLRNVSLDSAISQLKDELSQIDSYFEKNKEAQPINPTFGPLNKEEWIQFHKKHLTHHFTQFGLLEE